MPVRRNIYKTFNSGVASEVRSYTVSVFQTLSIASRSPDKTFSPDAYKTSIATVKLGCITTSSGTMILVRVQQEHSRDTVLEQVYAQTVRADH